MRPGKELNLAISTQVMGYTVVKQKNGIHVEATPKGVRPVKEYSTDVEAAFEVAQKLGVTLIPISDGSWFAFIGEKAGWDSPAEFIQFLSKENFQQSGAAVAETAPMAICIAALKSAEKKSATGEQAHA